MSALEPAHLDARGAHLDIKVESGFLNLYTSSTNKACRSVGGMGSCRDQLLREVSCLIKDHTGEDMSITLAGHTIGSALTMLLGYDITGSASTATCPGATCP
ncbi:hypothetical protein BAE44_0021093 [Dichanthelium oligosanthes]|uniref:Fungal lipase-type domain-containing protein n=1 Tax=Dichanthelium oligosanthes TaxID=888268 RepID=A0A1E5UYJ0_9POAL|nr:hypothetical protein BAE44_0021093 [Dichanthelium oligosanthes]